MPVLTCRAMSKSMLRLEFASRRLAARTSLALIVLVMAGVGPASARADVFTDISPPTISGSAVEGETLSETHATWSTPPSSYYVQWQRCASSGNRCQSIEHATAQTYRLTSADVGFTIRASESATNSSGAVTPSVSDPTAVVQARASGNNGGEPGHGGGSNPPPGNTAPTHVGSAEIKTLLARQLVPSGRAASISRLLKSGSLSMSFKLPEAGTLVVGWYLVPAGAKLASKTTAKPILVAAGQVKFAAAGTLVVRLRLTAQGRKLLGHAKKIRLTAKGAFTAKGEAAASTTKSFTLKR